MKLSELITAVGDENVGIQNLDQCAIDLNWSAKKGTKITFGTDQVLTPEGLPKLGMVVWLDRKAVADALAKAKQAGAGEGS
jgi:hypothetical protein